MLIKTPSKSTNNDNNINTISISSHNKSIHNNSSISNSPIKLYCENISEINKQNENGWTPIYRSIIANNLEILVELLKLGANPNLTNNIGETPLYLCIDIDNYEALNILLKNNADCNISKKDGTTPLHLASKKKKDKFIKILLENGANPNLTNKLYSQTPLHLSIINKADEDILLCFKKNGADFFGIKDKYDKTPLDYAKELKDEKYFEIVKKVFKIKENEKNNENIGNENVIKTIKNNSNNDNEKNLNLKELYKNIDISINSINKNEYKTNLNEIEIESNNNIENIIKKDMIIENKNKNLIKNCNINREEKKESLNNNEIIDNINYTNFTKYNYSLNKPQIYQPKKSIKNNQIKNVKNIKEDMVSHINQNKYIDINNKNNNDKSKKNEEDCSSPDEELLIDHMEINNNEVLTSKGKDINHNLGLGITLTAEDNNIHKSKTEQIINTSISNEKHPKLSTLSENEILKNIIIDTAKKIKKNSYPYQNNISLFNYNNTHNNTNENNISLDNKSNSLFSPINTLKSESDKNKINNSINNNNTNTNNNSKLITLENGISTLISNKNNNSNEITQEYKKEGINSMNPLDLMNQVITTNSNNSNDTQEQLLNNNFNNTNNNNLRGDSDLLEYSKSYVTNITNLNINTDENTLNNNINNINNNSNKKNEFYKKISYHCGKYTHKNKGINLINNNNFNNFDENDEENINEDESENDNNEDRAEDNNINSIKYKKINMNNQNPLSTLDNSKLNCILDKLDNNNNIQKEKNINQYPYQINSTKNNEEYFSTKNESTPNNKIKLNNINTPVPMPFNGSNINEYNSYKEKINKHVIGNSSSSITNTSSMKKYAKKLSILNELENSKNNNNHQYNLNNIFNLKANSIMPIKTSSSNFELITNENDSSLKIGSPQNIPNDLSSKLHDWLISCDLLCYYNILIKNKLYNIEQYIEQIKINKLSITYKTIEDIGIKKPGHIYRFLLKLKIDAGLIDSYIYNIILDKYNRSSLNDVKISSSANGFGCCCFRENSLKIDKKSINSQHNGNDYYGNDNCNDIFGFLKKLNLLRLKENFIHNGFDQVEFIMIQMFSEYKFNKEILNEYLHIYSDEDKNKVLKKLYEEKKNICNVYNIEYDINEENEILTSRTENEAPKSNDSCILF